MVDPLTLAAFIPAALALNMTPGADMMFCIAQGLRSGARAAWSASAGIALGSLVHVAIAGAGLSAILAKWPLSLDVIRWIGVAYLIWLAVQALRRVPGDSSAEVIAPKHAFLNGLFVNLANPKVILFVLAFIPQFVSPDAGPVFVQFIIFGCVIGVGGLVINGVAGMFAGRLRRRFARGGKLLDYLTAGIFGALALRLAVLERS